MNEYPRVVVLKDTKDCVTITEENLIDVASLYKESRELAIRTTGNLCGKALFLNQHTGEWKLVRDTEDQLCLICIKTN